MMKYIRLSHFKISSHESTVVLISMHKYFYLLNTKLHPQSLYFQLYIYTLIHDVQSENFENKIILGTSNPLQLHLQLKSKLLYHLNFQD